MIHMVCSPEGKFVVGGEGGMIEPSKSALIDFGVDAG